MDVLTRMRTDWDERAREDPLHYIAKYQRDPQQFDASALPDVAAILDGVRAGGRVLEIGAGIGRLLVAMSDRFDALVGVDISPRMVELSAEYLAGHSEIQILLNDGASLPLPEESFDFVFSYITFQHIPDRRVVERYIAEAHRVLKRGGTFRFQVCMVSPKQRVGRPLGLVKPGTWTGYNWTERGLKDTLERSPFGRYDIRRATPFLWATAQR